MSQSNHQDMAAIAVCDQLVRSKSPRARNRIIVGGALAAFVMIGTPAALAETCTTAATIPAGTTFASQLQSTFNYVGGYPGSVTGNILSAITTAQTAFLLQSTSFVSSPGNPAPDQQGSGVWTRSVGGTVEVDASSRSVGTANTVPPSVTATGNASCDTKVRQNFAGVQFGHDLAKLNVNGWNITWGNTAGYLEGRSHTVGGTFLGGSFNSSVQTPFVGTYVALSKGGFFFDALLRGEWYEASLNSAVLNISNQSLSARGVSIAASTGYYYAVPNTRHFIEPSVGVVHSRTKINDISGQDPAFGTQGTLRFNDIDSTIGRAGVRVGTVFESGGWVLAPFAAASIWHEFGKAPTARFSVCANCLNTSGFNLAVDGLYTGTTVGTYGQYSLGLSGQLLNTGWVAFVRGDYRKGSNIDGWDGTGGVRYHFSSDVPVPVIGKAPVLKAPAAIVAYNWTGFYIGAQAGADYGRSTLEFAGIPSVKLHPAGFIGGGQAGYNYQYHPNWVAGIEGEVLWTNLEGSRQCRTLGPAPASGAGPNTPLWNSTCHTSADWIAVVSGRLGYVWGRALWYGKLGVAWAHETFSVTCNINNLFAGTPGSGQQCANPALVVTNGFGTSRDRVGVAIGYGTEFAMTNKWTARAETDYIAFGKSNLTANDGTVFKGGLGIFKTTVGVNYKLN